MKKRNNENRGFTLIELLVVIAIIGLLSSIVLASLNTARAKSRDGKRLSDLHQIALALELYKSDNGVYPATSDLADGEGFAWQDCGGHHGTSGSNGWVPNLAPTYIKVLPKDPNPIYDCYRYMSADAGKSFMVMGGTVETYTATKNPSPRLVQPANFAVYSPGGGYDITKAPGSW